MKMQMMAHHNTTYRIHSRKLYQGRLSSATTFSGIIPSTVGKIAPIYHRRAAFTTILRDASNPGVK